MRPQVPAVTFRCPETRERGESHRGFEGSAWLRSVLCRMLVISKVVSMRTRLCPLSIEGPDG